MTQYRFTSAALTELRQATLYYEQRENGLGAEFLDEIEATLNRILHHPTVGTGCLHEQDAVELIAFRLV
jgi:plasmid stabilization system protein ParE